MKPGVSVLADVAQDPDRRAIEPNVDGIRCLVAYLPDETIETRNWQGERRDWLRHPSFAAGVRRLAESLPILYRGTVLDGELTTDESAGPSPLPPAHRALVPTSVSSSSTCRSWPASTSFVAVAGAARAPRAPGSRLRRPVRAVTRRRSAAALAEQTVDGRLEGLVVKDRRSLYRDGSRAGWFKVKDRRWYEREASWFERR